MSRLDRYQKKRDFKKTEEPRGEIEDQKKKRLSFVIQHHIASRSHYDLRLEWRGVLLSWAVPKGPSYDPGDKRLAIKVEDHPLSYASFEGAIPQGEYGGGTVMLWDKGTYVADQSVGKGLEEGVLKFTLRGQRLQGRWALVRMEEGDNWLLIKERDQSPVVDIRRFRTGIESGRTMAQIARGLPAKSAVDERKKSGVITVAGVEISNPSRLVYEHPPTKKIEVIEYYRAVSSRMLKYTGHRILSVVRCHHGVKADCFFKKHRAKGGAGVAVVKVANSHGETEEYFYVEDEAGLIAEAQLGTIEFHIWGSRAEKVERPDLMVFDLDPDVGMSLERVRRGVKDLKAVLDELRLKSFLKTSGGKGYHVIVPFSAGASWQQFHDFARDIARLMEKRWPSRYTSNSRKDKRSGKIFIDWIRNGRGATSVAPYSLRARPGAKVSMPLRWSELAKIAPDGVDLDEAKRRVKRADPWKGFFEVDQSLK